MSQDYLGRGWSFPPIFDRHTVDVVMTEREADVEASLKILLTTMRGERVMLPLYGCDMQEMLFRDLDTRTTTLLVDMIETAILYHEPRISVQSVRLYSDPEEVLEGKVIIEIDYVIKATNSRFNFVFPFYKIEGTDINATSSVQLFSPGS